MITLERYERITQDRHPLSVEWTWGQDNLSACPPREPNLAICNVEELVQRRLTRAVATSDQVKSQVDRAINTKVANGQLVLGEPEEARERQHIAISTAQKYLRKGPPTEYLPAVNQEIHLWNEFISSGQYDDALFQVRNAWKQTKEIYRPTKPANMSDDVFFDQLYKTLVASALSGAINCPLGPISNDDVTTLMQKKAKPSLSRQINRQSKSSANSTVDGSGLDWQPLFDTLAGNPNISKTEHSKLNRLHLNPGSSVRLALELCPLYAPGKLNESYLVPNAEGLESILNSRVGKKWSAIVDTISATNSFLRSVDRSLEVQVSFADWEILTGKYSDIDRDAVNKQAKVYSEQISLLLEKLKIPYLFQKFSQLPLPGINRLGINQFAVGEDSPIVKSIPEEAETISMLLGLSNDELPLNTPEQSARAKKVLKDLLISCEGNLNLARALARSYILTLPRIVENCDLHLGVERSANLLELPTLSNRLRSTINILVA